MTLKDVIREVFNSEIEETEPETVETETVETETVETETVEPKENPFDEKEMRSIIREELKAILDETKAEKQSAIEAKRKESAMTVDNSPQREVNDILTERFYNAMGVLNPDEKKGDHNNG
jgi:hypothetical protein